MKISSWGFEIADYESEHKIQKVTIADPIWRTKFEWLDLNEPW